MNGTSVGRSCCYEGEQGLFQHHETTTVEGQGFDNKGCYGPSTGGCDSVDLD